MILLRINFGLGVKMRKSGGMFAQGGGTNLAHDVDSPNCSHSV